ncbi:GGDEF domain-containing protein [Massilia glaciei]|uniref:diguanylate cyclase n=1 Tax=Massilia glaciei TaxID=1524097 RepID=A0A2U2HKI6_9BURK|nr:diguanylate cyclase [Massilia glaciei]PWF47994.1 GGDEF domain-containing protein [Massilia glaciei]
MKILIADDDPSSILYLQDMLGEWGYEVEVAVDGNAAAEILRRSDGPLLAILDSMMPGMDGIDVCRGIRQSDTERYVYMIILTSRVESEFIVAAMNAGADDFISKPFNDEEMRVRVRAGRRIVELGEQLRRRASRDALTNIYNRGAIIEILEKELSRQGRSQHAVSILFCDVDNFKAINDTHGHLAGDEVLRVLARRMAATLRPYDSFGRYGGEEMLGVFPDCGLEGALEVAERMRAAVAEAPVKTEFGDIDVTVSIGLATVDKDQTCKLATLLQRADDALYRAKANGKNCITIAH